jgi:hypothetical protein
VGFDAVKDGMGFSLGHLGFSRLLLHKVGLVRFQWL